jgi:hypothetical protein
VVAGRVAVGHGVVPAVTKLPHWRRSDRAAGTSTRHPGRLPRRRRRGRRPPVRRAGRCVPPPRMNHLAVGHDPTSRTCGRASSATVTAWSEYASTRARDAGGRGQYPRALLSFIAAGVARHAAMYLARCDARTAPPVDLRGRPVSNRSAHRGPFGPVFDGYGGYVPVQPWAPDRLLAAPIRPVTGVRRVR